MFGKKKKKNVLTDHISKFSTSKAHSQAPYALVGRLSGALRVQMPHFLSPKILPS